MFQQAANRSIRTSVGLLNIVHASAAYQLALLQVDTTKRPQRPEGRAIYFRRICSQYRWFPVDIYTSSRSGIHKDHFCMIEFLKRPLLKVIQMEVFEKQIFYYFSFFNWWYLCCEGIKRSRDLFSLVQNGWNPISKIGHSLSTDISILYREPRINAQKREKPLSTFFITYQIKWSTNI